MNLYLKVTLVQKRLGSEDEATLNELASQFHVAKGTLGEDAAGRAVSTALAGVTKPGREAHSSARL